ncbi:hypothetical protein GCM10007147_25610 [Nocardiopsis kunsanensis]|uniref:Uncharacterized protein n=1 Tax=Nocardiopsis kunsanensis TaxID=141693 RepID=A0A918XDH6_9ACTN|nr:hypothetical protein GCM10007147_25610 [Nocardiopsis kunsanensis]
MSRPEIGDRFDDEDYRACTVGAGAEMVGATPAFLRALVQAELIEGSRRADHRLHTGHVLLGLPDRTYGPSGPRLIEMSRAVPRVRGSRVDTLVQSLQ